MIKSRREKLAVHVDGVEKINIYRILVTDFERKRRLERPER
jgi:hypothetical protein